MDVVLNRRWSPAGWQVNPRNGVSVVGIIVLCLALCAPTPCAEVSAQTNPDSIPVSRWIDSEGREPMTYDEWRNQVGEPKPFVVEQVTIDRAYTNNDQVSRPFAILINADLYSHIKFEIQRYIIELTGEGYSVSLHLISGGTPEDIRTLLQQEYTMGIEGCIFIGDLPIAWFETFGCFDEGHEQFPCDLFYMDLDGVFTDSDGNGLYDEHTGDVGPELFFGRLTASTLTYTGESEIELLRNYFHKNHFQRSGLMNVASRALIYMDDDWSNASTQAAHDISGVYDDWSLVDDKWETWDSDYELRLLENYELVHLNVHSSAFQHVFKRPPNYHGHTTFSEIIELNPSSVFYVLHSCSNARFIEENYQAGWYVFSRDPSLVVISRTKIGGIWADQHFYPVLAAGYNFGSSLRNWLLSRAANQGGPWSTCWLYGVTLIGDPTLKPSQVAYEILQYDAGEFAHFYRVPELYPLFPDLVPHKANHYGVRFTATEDCVLDEIHHKINCASYPDAYLYIWRCDGKYPTIVIDSIRVGGHDFEGARYWGRKEVRDREISFSEGDEFIITYGVLNWPAYYDYLTIEATDDVVPGEEGRSVLMADGQWYTVNEFWGVDQTLGIRVCYDPAPGVRLEITPVELPDGEGRGGCGKSDSSLRWI